MKNKESHLVALLVGLALLALSFYMDGYTRYLFNSANTPVISAFFGIITNYGVVLLVMLIVPCLALYRKDKKLVYLLIITFLVSFLVTFGIKLIVQRERPFEALTYFFGVTDYSFPSGHSVTVFSLLPLLAEYIKRQKKFWAASAFLVAFSRVYLGFHFLSDVVFGSFLGYLIGHYMLNFYKNKYETRQI